jgi:hypothetical protein
MMIGKLGRGNTPGQRTIRVTSLPLSTGMSRSINMTSGLQVRIASSAVSGFDRRLGTEVHQHRAGQAPHIEIVVGDQNVETLNHFSTDLLVSKCEILDIELAAVCVTLAAR